MEPLLIYLAKASCLIAVFFIAYTAFLKKETFFTQNRFFLLAGLLTSAILPLVVFTKIVWVEPQPVMTIQSIDINQLMDAPTVDRPFSLNWLYLAVSIYVAGLLFFLIHFLKDFYIVKQMLHKEDAYSKDGFKYIDSDAVQSPFSFFKYIVYNSAILRPQELNDIVAHEKMHSSQWHSLDIITSQLFCVAFWFNPFVWMYKKAVSQNLEFIADAGATKSIADKKAYQKTLLKITMQPECIAITNHFYQSLIKKRIVMLNKQQSKKRNFYKYALVVPVLGAFVALFQVEVLAQEKEPAVPVAATLTTTKITELRITMDVSKDTNSEKLIAESAIFKNEFDVDVTFSNIKRNSKNEITAIKVTVKDKDNQKSYPVREVISDNDTPIHTFIIDIRKDGKTGKNIINFEDATVKPPIITQIVKGSGDSITRIKHNYDKDDRPDPSKILYVIDGVPQKKGSEIIKNLAPDDIATIDVLKDDPALVKLYGQRAKKGVIRITTKKRVSGFSTTLPATPSSGIVTQATTTVAYGSEPKQEQSTYTYTTTYTTNNQNDLINNLLKSSTVDYKKAYILINGKPATPEQLEKVNPKKVTLTTISPGNDKIITKYGEKAANGIITIDLKGYQSEISKIVNAGVTDKKNIVEDKDNTGYIIHKKSSKKDIKYYTKALKEKGFEVTIKNIQRNKEGIITLIEVELTDTKTGTTDKGTFSGSNGILDVFVGLKKGKPFIYLMG